MHGFVESVAEHRVDGWAFDETEPARHVTVSVALDGITLASGLAASLRGDLRTAGIGQGDHGFTLFFAAPVPPEALARVAVRATVAGESVALPFLDNCYRSLADRASDAGVPVADETQHPVFVLGPARSGTSAVTLALLRSGRYEGSGEGHLLPLVAELTRVVDGYYAERRALQGSDTLLNTVQPATFQRMIRRGFVQLARAAFPSGYWLDKTPTGAMVRAAPLLQEIWPRARFIMLTRRVIETVQSRCRKFPHETVDSHYHDWADVMGAWLAVRDGLGDAAVEIDQFDLAWHGDRVAAQVARFLALPAPQAAGFAAALATEHPERTAEHFGAVTSLDSLGLADADRHRLIEVCTPIMTAFGYGWHRDYFVGDAEPARRLAAD